MKKIYTTPEIKLINVNPLEIICVSGRFGDGDTDVMHSKQQTGFFDDEDDDN